MWVKRIDTRFLKGGKDSVSLKGLAADILDKAKEFELRNIRTSIPNSDINSHYVIVLQRLEYYYVERLEIVSRIR